jgi:hypothetical protein
MRQSHSGILLLPLLVLTALTIALAYLQDEVYAISPSFPRQVIIDGSNDWDSSNFLSSPSSKLNSSQCNPDRSFFSSTPDIEEINYLSDGKTLNATIWLSSAFEEPSDLYNYSFNRMLPLPSQPPPPEGNTSKLKNLVSIETKSLDNKSMTLDEYTNHLVAKLAFVPVRKHQNSQDLK